MTAGISQLIYSSTAVRTTWGIFVKRDVQSAPVNCSSAGLPPELTAKLYSSKHCNTGHGDDGARLYFSPDIRGKETYDVQRALEDLVNEKMVDRNRIVDMISALPVEIQVL